MKGLVRIRLARLSRKSTPFYNIVVTQSSKARDAKPIEVLGTYNPIPIALDKRAKIKITNEVLGSSNNNERLPKMYKDIQLDFDRTKYWIGVGAQPSDTVSRLLRKCGILPELTQSKRSIIANTVEINEL